MLLPRKGAVNAGLQRRIGVLGPLEGSVTEDVPHAETPYNESINTRITRVSLQEVKRFRVIET